MSNLLEWSQTEQFQLHTKSSYIDLSYNQIRTYIQLAIICFKLHWFNLNFPSVSMLCSAVLFLATKYYKYKANWFHGFVYGNSVKKIGDRNNF